MKEPDTISRLFALWVCLSLALPNPAFALRAPNAVDAGMEEEIAVQLREDSSPRSRLTSIGVQRLDLPDPTLQKLFEHGIRSLDDLTGFSPEELSRFLDLATVREIYNAVRHADNRAIQLRVFPKNPAEYPDWIGSLDISATKARMLRDGGIFTVAKLLATPVGDLEQLKIWQPWGMERTPKVGPRGITEIDEALKKRGRGEGLRSRNGEPYTEGSAQLQALADYLADLKGPTAPVDARKLLAKYPALPTKAIRGVLDRSKESSAGLEEWVAREPIELGTRGQVVIRSANSGDKLYVRLSQGEQGKVKVKLSFSVQDSEGRKVPENILIFRKEPFADILERALGLDVLDAIWPEGQDIDFHDRRTREALHSNAVQEFLAADKVFTLAKTWKGTRDVLAQFLGGSTLNLFWPTGSKPIPPSVQTPQARRILSDPELQRALTDARTKTLASEPPLNLVSEGGLLLSFHKGELAVLFDTRGPNPNQYRLLGVLSVFPKSHTAVRVIFEGPKDVEIVPVGRNSSAAGLEEDPEAEADDDEISKRLIAAMRFAGHLGLEWAKIADQGDKPAFPAFVRQLFKATEQGGAAAKTGFTSEDFLYLFTGRRDPSSMQLPSLAETVLFPAVGSIFVHLTVRHDTGEPLDNEEILAWWQGFSGEVGLAMSGGLTKDDLIGWINRAKEIGITAAGMEEAHELAWALSKLKDYSKAGEVDNLAFLAGKRVMFQIRPFDGAEVGRRLEEVAGLSPSGMVTFQRVGSQGREIEVRPAVGFFWEKEGSVTQAHRRILEIRGSRDSKGLPVLLDMVGDPNLLDYARVEAARALPTIDFKKTADLERALDAVGQLIRHNQNPSLLPKKLRPYDPGSSGSVWRTRFYRQLTSVRDELIERRRTHPEPTGLPLKAVYERLTPLLQRPTVRILAMDTRVATGRDGVVSEGTGQVARRFLSQVPTSQFLILSDGDSIELANVVSRLPGLVRERAVPFSNTRDRSKGSVLVEWAKTQGRQPSEILFIDDRAESFETFPEVSTWGGTLIYTGPYDPELAEFAPNVIQVARPGEDRPWNWVEIAQVVMLVELAKHQLPYLNGVSVESLLYHARFIGSWAESWSPIKAADLEGNERRAALLSDPGSAGLEEWVTSKPFKLQIGVQGKDRLIIRSSGTPGTLQLQFFETTHTQVALSIRMLEDGKSVPENMLVLRNDPFAHLLEKALKPEVLDSLWPLEGTIDFNQKGTREVLHSPAVQAFLAANRVFTLAKIWPVGTRAVLRTVWGDRSEGFLNSIWPDEPRPILRLFENAEAVKKLSDPALQNALAEARAKALAAEKPLPPGSGGLVLRFTGKKPMAVLFDTRSPDPRLHRLFGVLTVLRESSTVATVTFEGPPDVEISHPASGMEELVWSGSLNDDLDILQSVLQEHGPWQVDVLDGSEEPPHLFGGSTGIPRELGNLSYLFYHPTLLTALAKLQQKFGAVRFEVEVLRNHPNVPEDRTYARIAVHPAGAGLEERIPLPSVEVEKKVVFITPEMADPKLFESLKMFKQAPGKPLPLVIFAKHVFHVQEIQRWLDEAGLTVMEIVNVQAEIEQRAQEVPDCNLFDVVAFKQAEYYLGTDADIHTVWSFEDLKNLGRFLGIRPLQNRLWEESLERRYATQV